MAIEKMESAAQAKNNPDYKAALVELLYQLADDDFIISHRDSEWLGLAPHIEEDVAFSSIAQNTMGHAAMYYGLLEELGEGNADDLAHLRQPEQFRNAVLLEQVNGTGTYLHEPHYDWAFTVIRHYFYDLFKTVRLESLKDFSSYVPLANTAQKVLREEKYHLYHWHAWMKLLYNGSQEAKQRLDEAIDKAWPDVSGLFSLGAKANDITSFGLIEGEELLQKRWLEKAQERFSAYGIKLPSKLPAVTKDGRAGQHTDDLKQAVDTLSEVYRSEPAANW